MRYLVILAAIGKRWQSAMRERGVKESTIESWSVYWDQLVIKAGTCKQSELMRVGSEMGGSLRTALWYMEKEGSGGE